VSESSVFVVNAELSALSTAWKDKGYAGGFVSCVALAKSIIEAIEKCEAALIQDGYKITIFDGAWLYDSDYSADYPDVAEAIKALTSKHDVEYGIFNTYGH